MSFEFRYFREYKKKTKIYMCLMCIKVRKDSFEFNSNILYNLYGGVERGGEEVVEFIFRYV